MKDPFSDPCLAPDFLCLRLIRSNGDGEVHPKPRWQAHQANVINCDDFCSDRRQSPFPWVQRPLAAPNPAEKKPFASCGHHGKISSMTLPGAVFLTSGLGSFASVLQRQRYAGPRTDW